MTPISNFKALHQIINLIKNAQNLEQLNQIAFKFKDYNHPQYYNDLGTKFFIYGDKKNAKINLIKGASYGLQNPSEVYSSNFAAAIGQCLTILLTEYKIFTDDYAYKATSLAYLYLSRSITMNPQEAEDLYHSRAILFCNHKNPDIMQEVIIENMDNCILLEPFIISDFYSAAKGNNSTYLNCMHTANLYHQMLDDLEIDGKRADEYSLEEIIKRGIIRHLFLIKKIEKQFKSSLLKLTTNELSCMI